LRSFLWIKLASLKDDSDDTDDACIMQYFLTALANFGILLALFFQNFVRVLQQNDFTNDYGKKCLI
jgi:hypothetical protein